MCSVTTALGRRALRRKRDKEERAEFYENEKMQDFVLKNIHDVVVELFERNNEVPFIACYRKEVRPHHRIVLLLV